MGGGGEKWRVTVSFTVHCSLCESGCLRAADLGLGFVLMIWRVLLFVLIFVTGSIYQFVRLFIPKPFQLRAYFQSATIHGTVARISSVSNERSQPQTQRTSNLTIIADRMGQQDVDNCVLALFLVVCVCASCWLFNLCVTLVFLFACAVGVSLLFFCGRSGCVFCGWRWREERGVGGRMRRG